MMIPLARRGILSLLLMSGATIVSARLALAADAPPGAPKHWAYVRPQRPPVPRVQHADWCVNPIDNFIAARLEKEGLAPSPQADRHTLIRRVSLDLIGLPPTPAEVDAFVADTSPDAYGKVVDRLLASPHYGERWALPWLDEARYADSQGYERDPLRKMWPYRQWVIEAFNKDMPFDQFTIEQLAGDLLPNATLQQKIATGFNRNSMLNQEAGSDQGEYFYYALVDRVNTTSTVWLGSTIGCCQCHNHKYDPFAMKDYYRLMAFFNGTADEGRQVGGSEVQDVSAKVTYEAPELKELNRQLGRLQTRLSAPTPELAAAQEKWEKTVARRERWTVLKPTNVESASGSELTPLPDGSILASGTVADTDIYTLTATTESHGITAIRLEVLPDKTLPGKGPGRSKGGEFALTHLAVAAGPVDGSKEPTSVAPVGGQGGFQRENGPVANVIAAKSDPAAGWAIKPETGKPHVAIFETTKDVGFPGGTTLTITLEQKSKLAKHLMGRFRISVTSARRPVELDATPPAIAAIAEQPADERTARAKEGIGGLLSLDRTGT